MLDEAQYLRWAGVVGAEVDRKNTLGLALLRLSIGGDWP
jgi:hypothetical protein